MSKPSSRRAFRKPNHNALGLAGALGEDGGDSDGDIAGNAEENASRAQRFATNLDGNRFREVCIAYGELGSRSTQANALRSLARTISSARKKARHRSGVDRRP